MQAEFRTDPAEVRAGHPAMLIMTVKDGKGNVVRDMKVVHEKAMHLIVVSADLSKFAHYTVWAQFQRSGRVITVLFVMRVGS